VNGFGGSRRAMVFDKPAWEEHVMALHVVHICRATVVAVMTRRDFELWALYVSF
jgi:hypothetical protein